MSACGAKSTERLRCLLRFWLFLKARAATRRPCQGSLQALLTLTSYANPALQGLRAAYERASGGAFEDLLRGADGADGGGGSGGSGGAARLAGAVHTNDVTLLRRPIVFTLAVGWESVQARRRSWLRARTRLPRSSVSGLSRQPLAARHGPAGDLGGRGPQVAQPPSRPVQP